MASIICRPISTVSVEHTLYPDNYQAHNCINEITADNEATYLQQTINNTANVAADSTFVYSGKLPTNNVIIKSIIVHDVAMTTTTELTNRRVIAQFTWVSGLEDEIFLIKKDLTTSFIDYSETITDSRILTGIQNLIQSNGNISFQSTIRTVGAKASGKNASNGLLRVTQSYIEIIYEEKPENVLIKVNGKYQKIKTMYIKQSGKWVEQNPKNWLSTRKDNTKFEYIYGGDV